MKYVCQLANQIAIFETLVPKKLVNSDFVLFLFCEGKTIFSSEWNYLLKLFCGLVRQFKSINWRSSDYFRGEISETHAAISVVVSNSTNIYQIYFFHVRLKYVAIFVCAVVRFLYIA